MRIGKKIVITSAIVVLLGLGAAFAFRLPIKSRLVEWRVQKNLQSCREALSDGDEAAAHRYALAAHQLSPRHLECLLALLRIDGETERDGTVGIAARVFRHPSALTADKGQALEVFLGSGDSVVFGRLFDQLSDDEKRQPQMLRIYASYLGQAGRIRDAAGIYEGLLKQSADPELSLQLASVLTRAAAGNPGVAERSQHLIVELLRLPDRTRGLRALRLLQAIPPEQWQPDQLLDATEWVSNERSATPTDRLLVHSIEIRADESRRDSTLDSVVVEFADTQPALVARWLGAMGEYDRALGVLDIDTARSSPETYIARLRILHRAGRLEEANKWLADPHRGVRPSVVSTLRAVVAPAAESSKFWKKALQQAALEKSADGFWRISGSAAAVGNAEIEMRAAVEALKRPGAHPSALELGPVFEWMYRGDRAEDLRQVFRTLIRREPDSPMLLNNVVYLEIVSGRFSDPLVEQLESLCTEYPSVAEFATSQAVALLARGEFGRARVILESAIADWEKAPAPALAAYSVVLKSTGLAGAESEAKFAAIHESVQWDQMLGVEREFFQSRLQAADSSARTAEP